jgi:hypothetical protein
VIADEDISGPQDGRDKEDLLNARQQSRRGGIMLLGGRQKLVAGGMSETDLGILSSMAFDRDMIAIGYGYLPAGFSTDAATYSNIGIFVLHEWSLVQQTMASWCSRLDAYLLTREERRRLFILPDYSGVQALADADAQKVKLLAQAAYKGVSTNDLIKWIGLPSGPQAFGDAVLVPKTMVDLAAAMASEGAPD